MIVTGYIIGLSCLFLITYRTLIAFISESKAVTIYINRFGEQYVDIFALLIIWTICLVGLIFLIRSFKREKVSKQLSDEFYIKPLIDQNIPFYNITNNMNVDIKKSKIIGAIPDSSDDVIEKLNQQFNNKDKKQILGPEGSR